jgi:predicted ABC-type ATPase
MARRPPHVVVLAGPNGAGKTTMAPTLLNDLLGVVEFVNADVVARGLSAFDPERAAIAAGRIMLERLHELARQGASFSFETTLASRSFARWLANLRRSGYRIDLIFLWLPSPEVALARVAERVRSGGHGVPADTVRRRFSGGLRNFFSLYRSVTSSWRMYDNSQAGRLRLIAEGAGKRTTAVADPITWARITRESQDEE